MFFIIIAAEKKEGLSAPCWFRRSGKGVSLSVSFSLNQWRQVKHVLLLVIWVQIQQLFLRRVVNILVKNRPLPLLPRHQLITHPPLCPLPTPLLIIRPMHEPVQGDGLTRQLLLLLGVRVVVINEDGVAIKFGVLKRFDEKLRIFLIITVDDPHVVLIQEETLGDVDQVGEQGDQVDLIELGEVAKEDSALAFGLVREIGPSADCSVFLALVLPRVFAGGDLKGGGHLSVVGVGVLARGVLYRL